MLEATAATKSEGPEGSVGAGVRHGVEPGPARRFQILSLDGGGIRGLYSAAILAALEQDTGVRVADAFDLIAGTSTGGIIALGLGAGLSPAQILEFYEEHGPRIFPRSRFSRRWRGLRHYVRAKHDARALEEALRATFGGKLLRESPVRLVVPSFNVRERDVYIFKTPHNTRYTRDGVVPMWKVALATAAAPTYLNICEELDGIPLADGGVWANNPVMVAIVEAVARLDVSMANIRAFSLGTADEVWDPPKSLLHGGYWQWRRAAVDLVLAGQSRAASAQARLLLGEERFLRVAPTVPKDLWALDTHRVADLYSRARVDSRQLSPQFKSMFSGHTASHLAIAAARHEGGSDGGRQPSA